MEFIDYDVKIDFEVSKTLKELFDEAEELAEKGDWEYFCVADMIDVACKSAYANKHLTREQWDIIISRYRM